MDKIHYIYKYFRHQIRSKNTRGHGIHSPYLYRFTHNAIYEKNPFYVYSQMETLRENLFFDDRVLTLKDYGTGNDREMKVMDIAKTSLKKPRWAQLMFRIVNFTKAKSVLELGTSLGLTTAYMASVHTDVRVVSLEGCEEVAAIARENFAKLEVKNIEIIVGDIDETLDRALEKMPVPDVVFFDANHTYEATMLYFNRCLEHIAPHTVFIFDDIYWSKEMSRAWAEIKKHTAVTASIDLFQVGIVFFNKSYQKKNFRMRF